MQSTTHLTVRCSVHPPQVYSTRKAAFLSALFHSYLCGRKVAEWLIYMENCIGTVPIHLKMTLTTKEAAEYSNIGINKIDSMLRTPNCPFVLFVGTKKLVKRKEFEQFISEKLVI